MSPGVQVHCHRGRRGSFEVKVGETLIYSKLHTETFPDFKKVAKNVNSMVDVDKQWFGEDSIMNKCLIM